jgi:thioredoxin 1
MNGEHEQFISDDNEALERIREKKLKELISQKEKKSEMSPKPVCITDLNFDEITKNCSLAMVDFWAEWCGPCRAFGPAIEEVAQEYTGKVVVGKLNVDENPQTAEKFQVFSIPTVLIMKNGNEVDRIVGCVPKNVLITSLKKHLG